MPRANEQKIKLLVLYDILQRETDEEHPLSTNEIIERLSARGIEVSRKILPSDIALLNKYGFEIVEAMNYADFMANDLLYDITETVKEDLSDGSGSIYKKMDDNTKKYLEAYNGNIYATPWLSGFEGITHNASLFESKKLYFADEGGITPFTTSSYTNKAYTGRGFVANAEAKNLAVLTEFMGLPTTDCLRLTKNFSILWIIWWKRG